jgi:aminopeptidase N
LEERRFVAARKFKIETVIGGNDHLTSIATVTFAPLLAGERVIRFQLLPNLRVARVTGAGGKEIAYIQEGRKADGSFYAILPEAAEVNQEYSLTIEYAGDKVITKAGNGSFYIDAREAWYPNLNDFQERALYDLTFRIPKRFHLISVGKLASETTEEGQNVTRWVTPKPVTVAGFNYGDYKKIELRDDKVGTTISGYYLTELPDFLSRNPAVASLAPKSMTSYALDQTRAQLEVCTLFFGKSPFDSIAITEQPNFNFGQSWPNLVYLPISAYIDSTQRWELFGGISNSFTAFVDEVTPHEVAHQWWGHAVGWATYHDQWLSEGFAEFSAALFLQQATGPKWQSDYIQFWSRLKRRILEKNQFGVSPNDAGPLWLGLRLLSPRSPSAYQNVTYPKGAYVLAMLRSVMHTNKDQDKAFIEMMHDFVETYTSQPASTESFKAIAEKHMSRAYDFENNGRLDWFFREWVYGTEVPRYQFDCQLSPAPGGKTKLHMTLTQSEVSDNFIMSVPIFADFGKGLIRLGQLPAIGNSTKSYDFEFPVAPKKVVLNAYKEILER